METVILVIISILLILGAAYFGYKKGYNEDKNIKVRDRNAEEEELDYFLQKRRSELADIGIVILQKEERVKELDEEYQRFKEITEDAKKSAEEAYTTKTKELHTKYQEEEKHLQENKDNIAKVLLEQIDKINNELLSLQNTKAATIEALQKEKLIQQQKDSYRLAVTSQEQTDIQFLRDIQYRISKPRLISMLIWQNYYQPIAKTKFPQILGTQTVMGVYKITNQTNEMVYIGQARDVRKRWMEHCKCGLDIDRPQGNKLYAAMVEDGLENFTFELLEACDNIEELNFKEQYYIDLYNSVDFGYNGRRQI